MNAFFKELGRGVLAQWKMRNFALELFPEIAQTALETRRPSDHVDVPGLLREFLLNDEQPFQTQSGFGQPELVVYDDPRFYIQILFWMEGTTDIHQHKFSGAFHVLDGSSIHSRFDFLEPQSISAHLRVGRLHMNETHLLETGSTVPIFSGRHYIHSLFHLDTPSATVVVRTHTDPGTGPQFTYLPPHLAVDPFHHDALTQRRKQVLDLLEQTQDPGYPELVIEMLAELDFERGFFILQNALGYLRALGFWEDAWAAFAEKHGALAAFVAPTLEEIIRRDALVEMRRSILEPEHRFFLALLLNVPQRQNILDFVAQRFPGDPAETILRWGRELVSSDQTTTWALDAALPSHLAEEEALAAFLRVLRAGLLGRKIPSTLRPVHAALAASSWRALVV
jgi:hypothetical protein